MALVPVYHQEDMAGATQVCAQIRAYARILRAWQEIKQGYRERREPFPPWTQKQEMERLLNDPAVWTDPPGLVERIRNE